MDMAGFLIEIVSGAVGGNIAGSLLRKLTLGVIGNSLVGIVGGALGGRILDSALGLDKAAAIAGLDIGTIISEIAGGGVGGGVLMVLIGLLRRALAR